MLHQDRNGNTAHAMVSDEEEQVLPIALELKKTSHFYRFLRRELVQVRTEAEREVVRSELVMASGKLLALRMKLSDLGRLSLEDELTNRRSFSALSVTHLQ